MYLFGNNGLKWKLEIIMKNVAMKKWLFLANNLLDGEMEVVNIDTEQLGIWGLRFCRLFQKVQANLNAKLCCF